jgi:hypothetical protein
MFQGEFSGKRAINNVVYPRKRYDEVKLCFHPIVQLFRVIDIEISRFCCST